MSLAQISIAGARSASVTAITPEPVPMSATRAGCVADPLERGVDELLRRRARREDPARVGDEGESVEVRLHRL